MRSYYSSKTPEERRAARLATEARRSEEQREKNRARDRARGTRARPGYQRTYREKNPEIVACRNAVARALRTGALIRQPCVTCGTTENVHAHHDDHSRPLDVVWLCATHHGGRERLLGLGRAKVPA